MTTLGELMKDIRSRLAAAGVEDPAAEARILVWGLLNLDRTDFITRTEALVSAADMARIEDAVSRRLGGEPPYRILGQRSFYGLEFTLSRDTLEPRPDTETLVDAVLEALGDRRQAPVHLLDLGTGTGAILIALLSELPYAHGTAVDLSEDALATATLNAARNGVADRFETCRSDWFENISGRYDVIVSNPPYIASKHIPALDPAVRDFDPLLALDGGADGLDAYRKISEKASSHLDGSGLIAVETGFDQRVEVEDIFRSHGFVLLKAQKDYGGRDRVQVFRSGT